MEIAIGIALYLLGVIGMMSILSGHPNGDDILARIICALSWPLLPIAIGCSKVLETLDRTLFEET